jgi:alpha-mannosidase
LATKVYPEQHNLNHDTIYVHSVPNLERTPPKDIINNSSQLFTTSLSKRTEGTTFGPSWSTHWFQLNISIPESFAGKTVVLLWDSDSEALIFDESGVPLQGLAGGDWQMRHEYIITRNATGNEKLVLYIEMACNGLFGVGMNGFINPPDPNRTFNLKKCQIAVFDPEAYNLLMEFKIVSEMAKHLPEDSNRGNQAIQCACDIIDNCDTLDRSTWGRARAIAQDFLKHTNGSSQHNIISTGHCHIDVAWLWPYDETKRKCARSWASQCEHMDHNSEYIFAQSQAQLYDWVKSDYPELYQKMKEKIRNGQFLPVGGTWVEMDGILPSGESMVRQFLYGQRFFKQEFGKYCTEFWLPDSFGYSGQLPQIIRGAKIDSFVTQKLSWNLWNKFPNNTMIWEGLDGSNVIAHFPPADTYCGIVNVEELLKTVTNAQGKEKMNYSLSLYGHGDGGGGPVPEMIHRINVCGDIDGLPKIKYGTPKQFFDYCKVVNETKGLDVWRGELYFEMHRGCYTSQAATKKGNRKGEFLLREIEILSTIAGLTGDKYPSDELERLWKLLLLNQFHDVLPGSSIEMVYDDAERYYQEIQSKGDKLREDALSHLLSSESDNTTVTVVNSLGWDRMEIIELPQGVSGAQSAHTGSSLAIVSAPSIGFKQQTIDSKPALAENSHLTVEENDTHVTIQNDFVTVSINKETALLDVYDRRAKRFAVKGGNKFQLFNDVPLYWDAWDIEFYHENKQYPIGKSQVTLLEKGPLRAAVQVNVSVSHLASLSQTIYVTAISPRIDFKTHVKWNEAHKVLKTSFPTTVRSTNATYEVQFGHLQRPTHQNTNWDKAQFEVHAQKWADLSEYNYGVSLLNDCKYGYSTKGNVLTLSLLRSPKAPDGNCDMGDHEFVYALYPHIGSLQSAGIIQEAYNLNVPLITRRNTTPSNKDYSFLTVNSPHVVIDTIKKAEDDSSLIVRFYEAYGGYESNVVFTSHSTLKSVHRCNLLEEEESTVEIKDGTILFGGVRPFEIVTLKLQL